MSMFMPDPRDKGLDIKVEGGVLTISIGVNALAQAIRMGFDDRMDPIKITDTEEFIDAVVNELSWEEEDGSTVVHAMFDLAAERAIHDGCEGVEAGEEQ